MTLKIHKRFTRTPEEYAAAATRIAQLTETTIVVTQDYMCEPFMLAQTGLTIPEHQRLTIERYDAIRAALPGHIPLMPVLQGYLPQQYVNHIADYGERLGIDMHVGVGSVCKRNASPREIGAVLRAIKRERPDLRLHGFGVKETSLESMEVRSLLHSADSLAWSFRARKEGRNANDWREGAQFAERLKKKSEHVARPFDALWN